MEIFLIILLVMEACAVKNSPQRREITIINGNNNLVTSPSLDLITPSIELALSKCQEIFQWDRWNCPSSDFLSKRKSHRFDRESAFVEALTAAALLYTITKKCSSGELSGCNCEADQLCSDDPIFAENFLKEMFGDDVRQTSDAQGYAKMHNNRAGRLVVINSLVTRCGCDNVRVIDDDDDDDNDDVFTTICKERKCWTILKDFSEIAAHLRYMYDNALLLRVHNSGNNDWSNIPKNYLAFINESPNYCLPGVIPQWTGMEGRHCSRTRSKTHSIQQRRSCKHLCRECGFRVRSKTITTYQKCNCTFVWCCDVKCEKCEEVETQYFCG